MNEKELTCVACPIGCRVVIKPVGDGYEVTGNTCKRGETYAIEEYENPTRMVPTTVKIKGAFLNRLPVITQKPIPKSKIFDCMEIVNKVEVKAPVKLGDIIVENILDTGIDIIATRSMKEG